jgi:hypothetical protein
MAFEKYQARVLVELLPSSNSDSPLLRHLDVENTEKCYGQLSVYCRAILRDKSKPGTIPWQEANTDHTLSHLLLFKRFRCSSPLSSKLSYHSHSQ